MKGVKKIEKQYTPEEIAESFVFPGAQVPAERKVLLDSFRKHRKKASEEQSESTKLASQLLQLRFLIEDYIYSDKLKKDYTFGYFLKQYIGCIDRKNNQFADEISVDPAELSQVINKRRGPTEKLIFRLEIHSNRNFPALMWFKILEKDRAYELTHNKGLVEKERKNVKHVLKITL